MRLQRRRGCTMWTNLLLTCLLVTGLVQNIQAEKNGNVAVVEGVPANEINAEEREDTFPDEETNHNAAIPLDQIADESELKEKLYSPAHQSQPQPQGYGQPVLVPLPIQVKPASIVIPSRPNQHAQPVYKPPNSLQPNPGYALPKTSIQGPPRPAPSFIPPQFPGNSYSGGGGGLPQLPPRPNFNPHARPPPPPRQSLPPPPPPRPQPHKPGPPPPPPIHRQPPPPPVLQPTYIPQSPPPKLNLIPSPSPPQGPYGGGPSPIPPKGLGLPPPPLPHPKQPVFNPPPPPQGYVGPPVPSPGPHIAPPPVQPSYGGPVGLPSDPWPATIPEMPKIVALDVKCEKNLMKVSIAFDTPFYGIIFSKGHYSNVNCVHLPAGLGRSSANFDVSINSCGTTGNTDNGLYGYGAQTGSGTFFENTIVVQYDPQVQEVWDQARKLRCTWHDQYEKSVTFRPFPVDMLDVVRADFAGDNVGCWMQIQVGKGPWASEVSGLVKIGQTMTMVLAIKDDDNKFDMLVRNCMAHDGKRAPIQLVDQKGCVTRPKLMSRFTKIKNFGASASVLSYAHFQAFKFPDTMEVHFQCTIQICRYQCPEQCASPVIEPRPANTYEVVPPADVYLQGRPRDERRAKRDASEPLSDAEMKEIGLNRIIQVVSTGDLAFALEQGAGTAINTTTVVVPSRIQDEDSLICMSTPGFAATLVVLLGILIVSCLMSAFLCLRFKGFSGSLVSSYDNPAFIHKKGQF